MGIDDAIVDLVSSGTTLKENNLKEIEGGIVLESQLAILELQATAFVIVNFAFCLYHILSYNILQAVLVASWKALIQRKGALDITRDS